MDKPLQAETPALPLRQWAFVLSGIVLVAVPWWLGMLWIVGALT